MEIVVDDLSDPRTRALLAAHLAGMHAASPATSVHALDVRELTDPSVTVWSARTSTHVAGIAALKTLDTDRGEVKSMRVDDAFLGRGVGRALVRHVVAVARERGLTSLWLETGSTDEFVAARRLYASEGFTECPPFPPYVEDPFSVFFTRAL